MTTPKTTLALVEMLSTFKNNGCDAAFEEDLLKHGSDILHDLRLLHEKFIVPDVQEGNVEFLTLHVEPKPGEE